MFNSTPKHYQQQSSKECPLNFVRLAPNEFAFPNQHWRPEDWQEWLREMHNCQSIHHRNLIMASSSTTAISEDGQGFSSRFRQQLKYNNTINTATWFDLIQLLYTKASAGIPNNTLLLRGPVKNTLTESLVRHLFHLSADSDSVCNHDPQQPFSTDIPIANRYLAARHLLTALGSTPSAPDTIRFGSISTFYLTSGNGDTAAGKERIVTRFSVDPILWPVGRLANGCVYQEPTTFNIFYSLASQVQSNEVRPMLRGLLLADQQKSGSSAISPATVDKLLQMIQRPDGLRYLDGGTVPVPQSKSRGIKNKNQQPSSGEEVVAIKTALRLLGFGVAEISSILSALYAVLLIGNIQFRLQNEENTRSAAAAAAVAIKLADPELVLIIASLLGIEGEARLEFEQLFLSKTLKTRLNGQSTVVFPSQQSAEVNRDLLAQSIYSLIIDHIISKSNGDIQDARNKDSETTKIHFIDMPSPVSHPTVGDDYECMLWNFANERIEALLKLEMGNQDVEYSKRVLDLISVKDDFQHRSTTTSSIPKCLSQVSHIQYNNYVNMEQSSLEFAAEFVGLIRRNIGNFPQYRDLVQIDGSTATSLRTFQRQAYSIKINHYAGTVNYDIIGGGFSEKDLHYCTLPTDLYDFIVERHCDEAFLGQLVEQHSYIPPNSRKIFLRSWMSNNKNSVSQDDSTATLFMRLVEGEIVEKCFSDAQKAIDSTTYTITFFDPKDPKLTLKIIRLLRDEEKVASFANLSIPRTIFSRILGFEGKSNETITLSTLIKQAETKFGLVNNHDFTFKDDNSVSINQDVWLLLWLMKYRQKNFSQTAPSIIASEQSRNMRLFRSEDTPASISSSSSQSNLIPLSANDFGGPTAPRKNLTTNIGEAKDPNKWMGTENSNLISNELTKSRKIWVAITNAFTFFIPEFALKYFGMKDTQVQMAFREKLALCIIILIVNILIILLMMSANPEWFPREIAIFVRDFPSYASRNSPLMLVYNAGYIWRLKSIVLPTDSRYQEVTRFIGKDLTRYPRTGPQSFLKCPTLQNERVLELRRLVNNTDNMQIRISPLNIFDDQSLYQNVHGYLAFSPSDVAWNRDFVNQSSIWFSANGNVYNMTEYFSRSYLPFLSAETEETILKYAGSDIPTEIFNKLETGAAAGCLLDLYRIGKLGHSQSAIEIFAANLVTCASIFFLALLFLKLFSVVQVSPSTLTDPKDKFLLQQHLIMFVPCYTEDRESLKKTIDSLVISDYPDDRKLLFIVCDGLVTGKDNKIPTPQIVLDLLGSRLNLKDSQAFPFDSTGEDSLAYNEAKVYSGHYQCGIHNVPYIVVVKIGHPHERVKPGNRGKRDSQALVMTFLSKVFYRQSMNPLELEIFYHLNFSLQIEPDWLEFFLMVDADTTVSRNALLELMNQIVFDPLVIGICGETQVENTTQSFVSMVQVFEYFISHRLAKAFESLFGSVTCLPGCFCLWRVKSKERNMAILVSKDIIVDFKSSHADTLHNKNLLLLGEDRYLTTLMLKNFEGMTTNYLSSASCKTVVPVSWKVLFSQRRRWINSTVHNLFELLFVDLCGFGFLGMRFMVLVDLISTVILPGSFIFSLLVFYQMVISPVTPNFAISLIALIYGAQILIVLLSGKIRQLGWMLLFILAIPAFQFVFPIYAFWNFDNFTWGSTRTVAKPQIICVDSEKDGVERDSNNIELRKWDPFNLDWREYYASGKARLAQKQNGQDEIGKTSSTLPERADPKLSQKPGINRTNKPKQVLTSNVITPTPGTMTSPRIHSADISSTGLRHRTKSSPDQKNFNNGDLRLRNALPDLVENIPAKDTDIPAETSSFNREIPPALPPATLPKPLPNVVPVDTNKPVIPDFNALVDFRYPRPLPNTPNSGETKNNSTPSSLIHAKPEDPLVSANKTPDSVAHSSRNLPVPPVPFNRVPPPPPLISTQSNPIFKIPDRAHILPEPLPRKLPKPSYTNESADQKPPNGSNNHAISRAATEGVTKQDNQFAKAAPPSLPPKPKQNINPPDFVRNGISAPPRNPVTNHKDNILDNVPNPTPPTPPLLLPKYPQAQRPPAVLPRKDT